MSERERRTASPPFSFFPSSTQATKILPFVIYKNWDEIRRLLFFPFPPPLLSAPFSISSPSLSGILRELKINTTSRAAQFLLFPLPSPLFPTTSSLPSPPFSLPPFTARKGDEKIVSGIPWSGSSSLSPSQLSLLELLSFFSERSTADG